MNQHRIVNLSDPLRGGDASHKNYVDTQVRGVLKTDSSGDLDMKTRAIKNVKIPTNSSDATNKIWVENQITSKVGVITSQQLFLEEKLKNIPLTVTR